MSKTREKDVVSVVKHMYLDVWWVAIDPSGDIEIAGDGGVLMSDDGHECWVCYSFWLRITGIKLKVREPVRVRLSAVLSS